MDVDRLLRGLDAVEQEAERRFGGEAPDRRFDLVIDATFDLMDVIEPKAPPENASDLST